jgi:hypothetical protein
MKTELKRLFDKGLLLSSYNIYSQFMPWQMEDFILELVALEIAYHAGGLSKYEITKKWTELIWDVDELKRIMTEDKLHNNPMCRKFLLALEKQDVIAPRKGVRQIDCATAMPGRHMPRAEAVQHRHAPRSSYDVRERVSSGSHRPRNPCAKHEASGRCWRSTGPTSRSKRR